MQRDPLRILAVSGSRADWGFLSVPLSLLRADPRFALSLAVTGQHLETGSDAAILAEGFNIAARIDMRRRGDGPADLALAMGNILSGMGEIIERLRPQLMLLLGDRYETLAAASAAMLARLPIAHLAGGDVSEGAIDDAIRHALSKLSHLHFPTNEDAAQRLLQMGESPHHIHMIGSTGLDRLLQAPALPRAVFLARCGLPPDSRFLLVTLHPTTLAQDPLADARATLEALRTFDTNTSVLITGANADTGGDELARLVESFARERLRTVHIANLGTDLYVNALRHCLMVVGNSSSGLYEAPSFGVPTVNVGRRQHGRLKARSVIDCEGTPEAVKAALEAALQCDCSSVVNPYGDGKASPRLIAALAAIEDPEMLLHKTFHNGAQRW